MFFYLLDPDPHPWSGSDSWSPPIRLILAGRDPKHLRILGKFLLLRFNVNCKFLCQDVGERRSPLVERKPVEMPDSTSQEREWGRQPFLEGEDILVQGQDGLLYFGIVVEVDHDLGQCLVRWELFFRLFKLRLYGRNCSQNIRKIVNHWYLITWFR